MIKMTAVIDNNKRKLLNNVKLTAQTVALAQHIYLLITNKCVNISRENFQNQKKAIQTQPKEKKSSGEIQISLSKRQTKD